MWSECFMQPQELEKKKNHFTEFKYYTVMNFSYKTHTAMSGKALDCLHCIRQA